MTIAEKEAAPTAFRAGWPPSAQFAFRQKDGTLKYYRTNPRSTKEARINDGINLPTIPR